MSRVLFLLSLLLLSQANSRKLLRTSDKLSSREPETNVDKLECEGTKNHCEMWKSMDAHKDYIYTQDVKEP